MPRVCTKCKRNPGERVIIDTPHGQLTHYKLCDSCQILLEGVIDEWIYAENE